MESPKIVLFFMVQMYVKCICNGLSNVLHPFNDPSAYFLSLFSSSALLCLVCFSYFVYSKNSVRCLEFCFHICGFPKYKCEMIKSKMMKFHGENLKMAWPVGHFMMYLDGMKRIIST